MSDSSEVSDEMNFGSAGTPQWTPTVSRAPWSAAKLRRNDNVQSSRSTNDRR
ncbi:hypothetical protein M404DRAFT_998459 [Pisolithus tinctorius Marx 270]|uniref:Uncharacterized protein n=1 Tax=Pisolithus tinctorius Marx 270 TaxID=870435 RepID=A0A0C3PFF7_PISTI|nr:hypothetical protein M404DRAFT_998459 [Pisolithus tinctorius Marx 270]